MFCPKCGTQNPDSAAFCGSCGETLSRNESTSTSSTSGGTTALAYSSSVLVPDGSVAAAANKTGRKLGIIIGAVVVIVVATIGIYFFACSTNLTYVLVDTVSYDANGDIEQSYKATLNADGSILRGTIELGAITQTAQLKNIGNGVVIPDTCVGDYATDSEDNVILVKYYLPNNPEKTFTATYSYYEPGIIKSIKILDLLNESNTSTTTYLTYFNTDGWPIGADHIVDGFTFHYGYDYEFENNGKSIIQTITNDDDNKFTYRFALDGKGNPIEKYYVDKNGENTLIQTFRYEKISKPARFVAAISQLKNY